MTTRNRLPFVPLLLSIITGCGSHDTAPSQTPAASLAGISMEEGEGGLYRLTVTDTDGMEMRIRIRWSEYDGMYRTDGHDGGLAGPLFGNPEPKFLSADDLRAIGRLPVETVHTIDPTLPPDPRWTNFEDVSVLHVYEGDIIIGRWEGEHITDIWYLGPFADRLRERLAQGESRCDALVSLCCREEVVDLADGEELMPRPITQACYGAAMACEDQAKRDATCPCMIRACFGVDMNLPWQLSTPAAGCCNWSFHLCGDDRARPMDEALERYADLFKRSPPALKSIAAVIDRLADEQALSAD